MIKITELSETRFKTVREKDSSGKRIPKQVAYNAYREVKVIAGGKRFAHFFVDGIVYYVIYYFAEYLWILMSESSHDPIGTIVTGFLISVIFLFAFPIYYILFEHYLQRTPGKYLTKSMVIDIYGNKPDIGTNILRNIIRLVPFEGLSCAFNDRGWHDKWSETFVVSEEEYLKIKELQVKANSVAIGGEIENSYKKPNKNIRALFLYVILPISIILYIGIVYRGCTKGKEILNNQEAIKKLKEQQKNQ
ncbi:MAG: RDD family protein [Bacteroidota bacterium]|nr:RDD family protein [Bacteroidota bacterium]